MESGKEALHLSSLRETAVVLSPDGRGRRGVGKQVGPDSLAAKALSYRLEREELLAASGSLIAADLSLRHLQTLKMAAAASGISVAAPAVPSVATDAVAVNCFKGMRRTRKSGKSPARSPRGPDVVEEEGEGEKASSLRQRRMKSLEFRLDSDDDTVDVEEKVSSHRQSGRSSRKGKGTVADAMQDAVIVRETSQIPFEKDEHPTQNPCNTPNISPPARPPPIARQVSHLLLLEAARAVNSSVNPAIEQLVAERQHAVQSIPISESAQPQVGSRRSKMSHGVQQPRSSSAERPSVEDVGRVSRRGDAARASRRVRAELGLDGAGQNPGVPSVKGSSRVVHFEQPELESSAVEAEGRGGRTSRSKQIQHKRKTSSDKENVSPETGEPPTRIPKLAEAPSPMSWTAISESTQTDDSSWVSSMGDIVMWRDVPRSSLFFGTGCFFIMSASFMQEMRCGMITMGAYTAMLHLSAVFIHRNFFKRELTSETDISQVTEADMLAVVRLWMPSVNFVLRKTSQMFSGDPSTTLRLTLALWLLAQAGYLMSFWTLTRVAFFALFIIPKCYASYSAQLQGQAKSVLSRLWLAWSSCSHKKLVMAATFLSAWNLSSFPARLCGAFILIVSFRLYQQTHVVSQEGPDDKSLMEVDPQRG